MRRTFPTGVKVVSVLLCIMYSLSLLYLAFIFIFINFVLSLSDYVPSIDLTLSIAAFLFISFLLLVFGFISAIYLWKGKEWARIATISLLILSIIGIIYNLFTSVLVGAFQNRSDEIPFTSDCFSSIIALAINGIIMLYLSSDRVKNAFLKEKESAINEQMMSTEVEPIEFEVVEDEKFELTCPNCNKDFEKEDSDLGLADLVCPFCGYGGDLE